MDFLAVIQWTQASTYLSPEERWWVLVSLPKDPPAALMPRPPEDGCASLLPEARVVQRRRANKRT